MLSCANLPKSFWGEAVHTACYLVNRSPSTALNFKTPQEVWTGKPPNLNNLKIFGCPAYFHVSEGKLEPRAKKGLFMGYPDGVKGYRIWSLDEKKCIISRDVVFKETELTKGKETKETLDKSEMNSEFQVEVEHKDKPSETITNVDQESEIVDQNGEANSESESEESEEDYLLCRDRVRREIKPPERFGYESNTAYALNTAENLLNDEPATYNEAVNCKQSHEWGLAMKEEMDSLYKNQTWKLVKKPSGVKLVGCKWIYKRKEGNSDGDPPRYKARLVAKGYTQREGIDYNEIFSPVVKHSSIRVVLAIVAQFDLHLEQMDVKTAFLHGVLEERIYMTQPRGFEVKGKEDHVCLLQRSLYGLKQSPRQWYKRFDTYMLDIKFKRSTCDSCVYYKQLDDTNYIYLLLYVDDMLIASKSNHEIIKLKNLLKKEFEMKDMGEAKKILGMEIKRKGNGKGLTVTQEGYSRKVITRFNMNEARSANIPIGSQFKLSQDDCPHSDEDKKQMTKVPYASSVGSLMYAMVCTRPDLAYALSLVSRYMGNPGEQHWLAVKYILRYLKGSVKLGLSYSKDDQDSGGVVGYVDSDFAGDRDKRRSLTGYVFTLFGSTVSWKASLQHVVALSTTEAEYIGVTEAVKEALWLKNLVNELGINQESVKVFCDNQSAIHLCKNQSFHERTKHIDTRLHWIKDIIAEGRVQIHKIHTAHNPADFITKVVSLAKFKHCLNLLKVEVG